MELTLCLHPTQFKTKEDTAPLVAIVSSELPMYQFELELEEVIDLISNNGQTFSPAFYDITNIRQKEHFIGSQMLVIDVDNKWPTDDGKETPESIIEKFSKYDLVPTFMYHSLSSSNENIKFRICWVLDKPIETIETYEMAQTMMAGIINNNKAIDSMYKNGAGFFFGGKGLIMSNFNNIYNLKQAKLAYYAFLQDKDPNNASRTFKKVTEKVIVSSPAYNNNISGLAFNHKLVTHKEETLAFKLENTDMTKCKLLYDFNTGVQLNHDNRIGIASNLIKLQLGKKHFMHIIENSSFYNHKVKQWESYLNYLSKYEKPYSCAKIDCIYKSECNCEGNILDKIKKTRGEIMIQTPIKTITLKESEELMELSIEKAMNYNSDENSLHVIKASPGIGKTKLILDYVKTNYNIVVLVPTHSLAKELGQRLIEDGFTKFKIMPELPKDALSKEELEKINQLYLTGLNAIVHSYLKSMKDNKVIQDYLKEIEEVKNTFLPIIMTHERGLYTNLSGKTLIFDEDPISSMFKIKQLSFKEFKKVANLDPHFKYILKEMDNHFNEDGTRVIIKLDKPWINNSKDLQSILFQMNVSSDVIGLLNASHLLPPKRDAKGKYEDIMTFIETKIPDHKGKIIILSATINEMVIRRIYKDRSIYFSDIGHTELAGEIIQDCTYSCSRQSLANNDYDHLNKIKEFIQDKPVITFAKLKSHFDNPVGHFGAIRGLDALNGVDELCIVGTPHISEEAYILMAHALDINLGTGGMLEMRYQSVNRNGMTFHFQTYSSSALLQELQISIIEAELIQAIHRSRVLRNDVKVYVFSNLGIPMAQQNKLLGEKYDSI